MAKNFAKRFYASKAWRECRRTYIASVFNLCERCGEAGYILHHRVYLTPQNINDPNITLNHELLEYTCQTCHNQEHHGSSEPITAQGTVFDEQGNLIVVGRGFSRG